MGGSKAQGQATERLGQITDHIGNDDGFKQKPSLFRDLDVAPPDAIFNLTASYKKDSFDKKVNLGVGAYRDNDGNPWVLPVVKKAKQKLLSDEKLDHEYLPILGLPAMTSRAAELIFGSGSAVISTKRIMSSQTISGTGAIHAAAVFLKKYYQFPGAKEVYISKPTWANHNAVFNSLGLEPKSYPYYSSKTIGLDFEGFKEALHKAPKRSVFLLHACAHNPTGVDPTQQQWKEIAQIMIRQEHFPFFDCAYQGFASGDLDRDAWAIRHFEELGFELLVCQSFAKNFGLYGERAGCLHIVTKTADAAARVSSQMAIIQRSEISNPPAFGARIVALVLGDQALFTEWQDNIKTMANRIIEMRKELRRLLNDEFRVKDPTGGDWKYIEDQIGMFSFTGLNQDQVTAMVKQGHIYLTNNGRISMAGLNTGNVKYVAECMSKAISGTL